MNNIGIIAEYNPFHNGHLYHLSESRVKGRADNIVVIMSGNFMQRGEPAVFDKWIRAEMAVKGGADLVIELPFIFACNNAEYFAYGAVKILSALNMISTISFGSESGSLNELWDLSNFLSKESDEFRKKIKEKLDEGISYPKARFETVKDLNGEKAADLLTEPNNILAVEYMKQLIQQNSHMKAMTFARKGEAHHQSATFIRNALAGDKSDAKIKKLLPPSTLEVMKNCGQSPVTDSENLFPLIMYRILISTENELSEILSSGEGLENRLKKATINSRSFEDLIKTVLSKRYTETRIRRMLVHTLISLERNDFFRMKAENNLYARVLAFSPQGARLLREMKKSEDTQIPVITNINKEADRKKPLWEVLKYDIVASDIYNLSCYGNIYDRSDHIMKPFGANIDDGVLN